MISVLITLMTALPATASQPAYGDPEILALEISGQLLAPPSLVSQVALDLAAIQVAFPEVAGIHVFKDWYPGVIVTILSAQAWADYQGGVFHEFNALNALYGPVKIVEHPSYTLNLEFDNLYHPEVLAQIYGQVQEILVAEPDRIDGDGDDITSQQVGVYTLKRGWGDCLAGCTYEYFWEFTVSGGVVELVDQYGVGTSVGDIPPMPTVVRGQNTPNPFNPSTLIGYRLGEPSSVHLSIYDVNGRLIRELVNGFVPVGTHSVWWDATDRKGREVSSGVYFYRLVVNGVAHTRKMVVAK